MGAWLQQDGCFGNFYLRTEYGGQRTFRNLRTNDPFTAQAELSKARAEFLNRPWASGNIRWNRRDWERFSNLRGQSRVAKQGYALAARAMGILNDADRWAWLLKPVPRLTALAELGRVQMVEIMRLAADELCERKPLTKEAVRLLRKLRGRRRAVKI